MAKKIASDLRVYYNGYDLGQHTLSVSITLEVEALDVTDITQAAERTTAGIRKDSVEWSGLFDDAASALNAAASFIASGTSVLAVHIGSAIDNPAYAGTIFYLSQKPSANIAELVKMGAVFKPDQAFGKGKLVTGSLDTTSGTGTSGTGDNAVASTNGGELLVQQTAFTGVSGTLALEHSSDGTAWAVQGTVTLSTPARTSYRKVLTGAINRYTRVSALVSAGNTTFISVILVRS